MGTQKFINQPEDIVQELLEGFSIAHADKVALAGNNLVVRKDPKPQDKVALVTLGGSGHEPALSGFVGEGLLDISVPGEVFAAPGPPRVLEALKMANRDAGVLFIVLNHSGDILSANMAMEMAEKEGINVKKIITSEDISTAPRDDRMNRRGLLGCLAVIKMAGAAAEQGKSLDEVYEIAARVEENMATLAVATTPATHPSTGDPISEIPAGEMVIGMGQHGEAGQGQMKIKSADETAAIMMPQLLEDLKIQQGEEVMVIINGVGSTTLMEQYIVLRGCKNFLESKGISMARGIAGEYLTVQEMGGFQMVVVRMDDELKQLWDAPCKCPCLAM
jgi:dihydroxyacetone kinase-like protein